MKFFDVMIYDNKRMQDVVYRGSLIKREAKKLMEELRKKGFKSQVLTSRNNRVEADFVVEAAEYEEPDKD